MTAKELKGRIAGLEGELLKANEKIAGLSTQLINSEQEKGKALGQGLELAKLKKLSEVIQSHRCWQVLRSHCPASGADAGPHRTGHPIRR